MSIIPYVIKQTDRGEQTFDIYSRLLSERIVFLGEEVSDDLAKVVTAQMLFMIPCNLLNVMFVRSVLAWRPVSERFCWRAERGESGWLFPIRRL